MKEARIIFIAGPTASGKSAAAMAVAEKTGGAIVNADAMQVYRDLRIVTARPSKADEMRAAHHLYGVFGAREPSSAGRWARAAAAMIGEITARGETAIVAGGTGLYFKALEDGLSPIPEIQPAVRACAIARWETLGPDAFHAEVLARDPAMAHLPPGDSQRLMRAWEVMEATGKPLSHFQSLPRQPLVKTVSAKALIAPPRDVLYARCDARAAAMIADGAIEEVKALLEQELEPSAPIMRTLGVKEIAALVAGTISADEALAALQQNTRRFAKRQMTWFRHQTPDWPRYESAETAVRALTGKR